MSESSSPSKGALTIEELLKIEVKWFGYVALILAIIIFSGLLTGMGWLSALDFTTLLGDFGRIVGEGGRSYNFRGTGGTGVRDAFLFVLTLIPGVILSLGIVSVVDYLGGLFAAQKLMNPVLRPAVGIPGYSGLAMIASFQSTDAGAAMTRQLYEARLLSEKERDIFSQFQFTCGAPVTNWFSTGAALFPYLLVAPLIPFAVIMAFKFVGANIYRFLFARGYQEGGGPVPVSVEKKVEIRLQDITKYTGRVTGTELYNAFIDGARRGWDIGIRYVLPNVIMAFVIIRILEVTGLLNIIAQIFAPIMLLWGLPGEGMMVLMTSFLSMGGGVGVALSLYTAGRLTAVHLTTLAPAIFLMGALVQYIGRLLAVAGVSPRRYGTMTLVSIINALLAMWVMRLILLSVGVV